MEYIRIFQCKSVVLRRTQSCQFLYFSVYPRHYHFITFVCAGWYRKFEPGVFDICHNFKTLVPIVESLNNMKPFLNVHSLQVSAPSPPPQASDASELSTAERAQRRKERFRERKKEKRSRTFDFAEFRFVQS